MSDKLCHQIYMDLFQPSAQRIGMSLFNITDKLSDRFDVWCNKLDREILPENRISPEPHLLVPILEGMVYHEDNTPIQEMFYNLLKNATDKTTQDLCHPSFPLILKQLSAEDISIVYLIEKYGRSEYSQQIEQFNGADILISNSKLLTERFKVLGLLNFGQTVYFNDPVSYGRFISSYILSEIGQQFLKACMSERTEELINEIINNKED